MILPRRRFLGTSLFALGGTLAEALATPLWKWKNSLVVEAAESGPGTAPIQFVDVAQQAGLTTPNVWGGVEHKRSIIETKGSGIAFFDYDNDGWLDIYLTNGNRLDTHWPVGQAPTSHLYKNNRDGTFTDVTENLDCAVPAGKQGFALATTTMMDGTTCFAVSGDITFCSVTTEMVLLPMLRISQDFIGSRGDGARVAHFSITTVTGTWIFSCAITSSLIRTRFPLRTT